MLNNNRTWLCAIQLDCILPSAAGIPKSVICKEISSVMEGGGLEEIKRNKELLKKFHNNIMYAIDIDPSPHSDSRSFLRYFLSILEALVGGSRQNLQAQVYDV